jgi:hypothetical protein
MYQEGILVTDLTQAFESSDLRFTEHFLNGQVLFRLSVAVPRVLLVGDTEQRCLDQIPDTASRGL